MNVNIIGAGAAGCFCAIAIKRFLPAASVTVYEAGPKALAKVAVTGGGRCNFTNSFEGISSLKEAYPRGEKVMKRVLAAFSHKDCMDWFEAEGIPYVIQDDHCVFPESQDAMQIVDTLLRLMREHGVVLVLNHRMNSIEIPGDGDVTVVTTGGNTCGILDGLGLEIERPVPSLFTFRINDKGLTSLMGTVAPEASLAIAGTSFKSSGALLLTDWGTSGPATLKLSSYAARFLAENGYRATLLVNWTGLSESRSRQWIADCALEFPDRQVSNTSPENISSRLWKHIISRSGIRGDIRWAELGTKGVNKIVNALCSDSYPIEGRCHFKEEFVTCGGVSTSEIDPATLECRKIPGLYFAGEILDIDAITGGFNLQAAWSTAMAVARAVARKDIRY